jgi:methylated-DNA-protein-cysteine methyltransferase related protein
MKDTTKNKEWFETVYEIVRQIPKGKVTTYGRIAELIGTRGSARMVGWAMNKAHNQKPKVPAHRVVNRVGILTGKHHFASITSMQEALEKEGIQVIKDQIVNFEKHLWLPSEKR